MYKPGTFPYYSPIQAVTGATTDFEIGATKSPVGKAHEEVKVTKTCGVVIGLGRRVFSLHDYSFSGLIN